MLDVVMRGEVAYRQLVLSERGEEKLRLPLLAPANDMLGWENPAGYAAYLFQRYGQLSFPRGSLGSSQGEAADFYGAAKAATKGHVAKSIAEHLERLRFSADGALTDVPDFAALAAWSVLEAVRRQQLRLRTCPTCKRKWLSAADERSRYCQRWAPGQMKDCRTLAHERKLAGSGYASYRREYNRITEAHRRGSLSTKDLFAWRDDNDATNWTPYEQWKENHNG
jgi:hypothetical protein